MLGWEESGKLKGRGREGEEALEEEDGDASLNE